MTEGWAKRLTLAIPRSETRKPMPRYFESQVVGRPLVAGDRSFTFEPSVPMGGHWLGVLAVDDDSAASVLATSESAWEITEERWDELKKKRAGTVPGYVPSRPPPLPPQPLVVPAARAAAPTASPSEAEVVAITGKPIVSVSLLTTTAKPPAEPLLEVGAAKQRRKAA